MKHYDPSVLRRALRTDEDVDDAYAALHFDLYEGIEFIEALAEVIERLTDGVLPSATDQLNTKYLLERAGAFVQEIG